AVESLSWVQAIIAVVTRWLRLFAKIFQQCRPPTIARFGIMNHLAKLLARDRRFLFAFVFDEASLFHHVVGAEKQDAFGRQTIAASPPRFLVVALDVLWQIVMHHKTHIRFIDSHPESDRRRDHANIIA